MVCASSGTLHMHLIALDLQRRNPYRHGLSCLQAPMQKWDVWLPTPSSSDWSETHQKYVPHCQMWQDRLLLNAANITVLSLGPNALRPPRLGHLPLRHLELSVLEEEQPWVLDFLNDLPPITSPESLTFLSAEGCRSLPTLQLAEMRNLKHAKLQARLPIGACSLPEHCLLNLDVKPHRKCQWDEHSQDIELHTSVLCMRVRRLDTWPTGTKQLCNLQCLTIVVATCWDSLRDGLDPSAQSLDVADLCQIPHVRLMKGGGAGTGVMTPKLRLTAGSWQTLDIRGFDGVAFTDIDAFVKGTERFSFKFFRRAGAPPSILAVIQSACQKHGLQCHEYNAQYSYGFATAISTSEGIIQAFTKHDKGLCRCPYLYPESYCRVHEEACLWAEDTIWPKNPCTAFG